MRLEDLTKENLRCTTDAVFKVLLSYQQELIFHIIQDCTENTPTKINLKNLIMPPIKDDKKTCIYDLSYAGAKNTPILYRWWDELAVCPVFYFVLQTS